ncbi:MAG TPA: thioredoxin family protein [Pirellulales bacterium]|nr:thioredoxin family protein [Pirellulales bacterium]
MMSVTLSAVLQVSLLATGANEYAAAHRVHQDTGRPMVLLVGAEWCPACAQMKNSVLPRVARRGLLRKVAFAHVNTDRDSRVARSVMQGGTIPQLIMYRKTNNGWRKHMLVGVQSPEAIETFINSGLELDKAEGVQASNVSYGSRQ